MVVKNGGTIWHRAKFDISGGAGTQQCQIDRSCAILTRTCAPQPSHLHKQCNFLLVLIKIAFLPAVSANMGSFLRIIPRIRFMWSLLFLSRNKSANLDKKTWQIHALLCNAGSLDKGSKMWVRLIFWEKNENHFWQRLFWKDPIITLFLKERVFVLQNQVRLFKEDVKTLNLTAAPTKHHYNLSCL